jgi:hypothetical protein
MHQSLSAHPSSEFAAGYLACMSTHMDVLLRPLPHSPLAAVVITHCTAWLLMWMIQNTPDVACESETTLHLLADASGPLSTLSCVGEGRLWPGPVRTHAVVSMHERPATVVVTHAGSDPRTLGHNGFVSPAARRVSFLFFSLHCVVGNTYGRVRILVER